MNQQKCRLCGERHRLGPCPQHQPRQKAAITLSEALAEAFYPPTLAEMGWIKPEADSLSAAKQPKRKAKPRNPKLQALASHQPATQSPKKRAPRGTFDRNAYQRELMRKRRAAVSLTPPLD